MLQHNPNASGLSHLDMLLIHLPLIKNSFYLYLLNKINEYYVT